MNEKGMMGHCHGMDAGGATAITPHHIISHTGREDDASVQIRITSGWSRGGGLRLGPH